MTMIATTTMMAIVIAPILTGSPANCIGSMAMSAKQEAQDWAEIVSTYGERRQLKYEPVGGINPLDGPVALCVGGSNRLTGQLSEGFWGSCCDADEKEIGSLFNKAVLPTALLAKA